MAPDTGELSVTFLMECLTGPARIAVGACAGDATPRWHRIWKPQLGPPQWRRLV